MTTPTVSSNVRWVACYADLPEDIRSHLAEANVFFSEAYARYRLSARKDYGFLFDSEFAVPVTLTKRAGFVYADLASEPYSFHKDLSTDRERVFLTEAVSHLSDRLNVMWVRQTPVTALFRVAPEGAQQIPFGSYVIDLRQDEEKLWSSFTSKYRQYGRQFKDAGGTVKEGGADLVNDFYALLVASMTRADAGIEPIEYYRAIATQLPENSRLFVAYRDRTPEAGLQILFNHRMSYTLYGGISSTCHRGSNIMMYWDAIRRMKALGVEAFSFVGCRINVDKGSKYEGIQTFKERFGGELKKGVMFKVSVSAPRTALFSWLQKARFALKGLHYPGDIVDQEIHKWLR